MIDLRSDTVTRPGRAMLEAMMAAPVGDDVYGDDPTVNELQRYAADLAGKEAALFLPTGTQANLVGLLSHCQRGEEYIVGQGAHNYLYEAGGAAVLGSIQPQPIDAAADGSLPLDKVAAKIKPDDIHFAPTRLLSLENTHNGKVLPRDYLQEAWAFTRQRDLALHVDGARIFNAVVAYGCELRDIAQYCDSFTICLSKGLGAPVGSLLLGSEAYIRRAIRWRKMVGGEQQKPLQQVAAGGDASVEDHVPAHRRQPAKNLLQVIPAGVAGHLRIVPAGAEQPAAEKGIVDIDGIHRQGAVQLLQFPAHILP